MVDMESVIFDGKEYVKASVLAERFAYTQDYLGQLCRAKKVDARLVGRAWYIHLDSITSHKKTRYKGVQEPPASETHAPAPHFLSRVDVEPVLNKKTVNIIKNEAGKLKSYPAKYEADDYSLIPKISREAVYKPIKVLPAEAEELKVTSNKEAIKVTAFKAEPLPEVYLKGVLNVDGIPEVVEEPHKPVVVENSKKDVPQAVSIAAPAITKQVPFPIAPPKERLKIKLSRQHANLPRFVEQKPATEPLKKVEQPTPVKAVAKKPSSTPIPVKRALQNETPTLAPKSIPLEQGKKIIIVPYATTKALLIFIMCVLASATLFSLKADLALESGSVAEEWIFSLDQIRNVAASLLAENF
jgi:hypothetical protein